MRCTQPSLSLLPVLLLISSCSDCGDDRFSRTEAGLTISPQVIDFGDVFAEQSVQRTATLTNVGTRPANILDIAISGVNVFSLSTTYEGLLGPGQSAPLAVAAANLTAGSFTGELIVISDASETPRLTVPLLLSASEPPPCDDGNACTLDSFDFEAEACSYTFADGLPCESADKCILDAQCQKGVCLGRSKSCAPESVCEDAFCRQLDGECISEPSPTACDDSNPCTADLCDESGCRHENIPGGTPCDDSDPCTLDDTCVGGACLGAPVGDGTQCDDQNSCTLADTCTQGRCEGTSMIEASNEGDVVFQYPLLEWADSAFLHRREVSLGDNGHFYGLDHIVLRVDGEPENRSLAHVAFAMRQCGTLVYEFSYRPPDPRSFVAVVRREMQLSENDELRIVIGVRRLPEDGFGVETTSYLVSKDGTALSAEIDNDTRGESGRSLLDQNGQVFGEIRGSTQGAPETFAIVREDRFGNQLWETVRNLDGRWFWAEFLGVAGPRVLFWLNGEFGALDLNTGARAWSRPTQFAAKEMALSGDLNLGVIRADNQIIGVEILSGREVFAFPSATELGPLVGSRYVPRTDPVISEDGRIMFMMELATFQEDGTEIVELEWVELNAEGAVVSRALLPYRAPFDFTQTRHEDFDDPYPTVAKDGISYIGYGDTFWALEPGGEVRWTLTSTTPNAFTGSIPVLREDGVLLLSRESREIIGVRSNGGLTAEKGWPTFRHDTRRTNFTKASVDSPE